MASMIDVVFLLLIFFMCTSSFRGRESDLLTQLPQVGGGAPGIEADFDPIRIRVSKLDTGVRVALDGKPCSSFDDLGEQLEKRRQLADVPVLIEGDPAVPFAYMVASLDACYEADLSRVAFSAKGAER